MHTVHLIHKQKECIFNTEHHDRREKVMHLRKNIIHKQCQSRKTINLEKQKRTSQGK